MGLVAAADMEVGLVAAKTELEVWLVWKEAGKDVGSLMNQPPFFQKNGG